MNKKWVMTLSVAAMLTTSGLVMASTPADMQESVTKKAVTAFGQGGFTKKEGMRGFHGEHKAVLDFLKIDKEAFKAAVESGKSLAAIGKEQGIAEQDLKNFMVEQISKRMEAAEKNGKKLKDNVKPTKAEIEKRVSEMINGNLPMGGHGKMGHAPFAHSKLFELLKMDQESFKAEIKTGKSLGTIANDHGVSEQALKDFMVQEMTQRIDDGVKAGKISVDKAEKMKANMQQRIADMVSGKGPMHRHENRDNG